MPSVTIEPKSLQGEITPPPDKSISHRAIIISSLANGKTTIKNLSLCADCLRTLNAFKSMGVAINKSKGAFSVQGKGLNGLRRPQSKLYLGNSGTSMRLILGVLAGQSFSCKLWGDRSLSQRPMNRVIKPLSLMGAKIQGKDKGEFAPLTIQGRILKAISYTTPIASAQVKSAVLLAGLYAEGTTKVSEPAKSRDHTERMLNKFGAQIHQQGLSVSVTGKPSLVGKGIDIPGDISSASFFLAGACISKDSLITIKSVGLNPTRIALLTILKQMGAAISWKYRNSRMTKKGFFDEATGEITASYSQLKGVAINPEQIPALIDELPVLMVAATQAEGQTTIRGAGDLRVKETDRIAAMVANLTKMGANITTDHDDIIIRGPSRLKGNLVQSFNDHRTAMSMAIAAVVAKGRTTIKNVDCVDISFPGFFNSFSNLGKRS